MCFRIVGGTRRVEVRDGGIHLIKVLSNISRMYTIRMVPFPNIKYLTYIVYSEVPTGDT